MAYTKKNLEQLNIMDDFLIRAIAADKEVGEAFCRETLSVLLQRKIGAIRVITQRTIPPFAPTMRGIRMDVEIVEDLETEGEQRLPSANIYDLEPHIPNNMDLLRHNRFYQARIDSRYLKSGQRDFSNMPNLFVITILNYDPFGYDYMMYTIRNQCEEIPELNYKDGLLYIYFYTAGTKGGTPEMKAMLKYFRDSTEKNAVNESTRKIHEYANQVRMMPEVRDAYMTFDDMIYWQRQDAAEEAAKETTIQCICDLLEEYGEISETIMSRLNNENDRNILAKWLKLAAKVNCMDEFAEKMTDKYETKS